MKRRTQTWIVLALTACAGTPGAGETSEGTTSSSSSGDTVPADGSSTTSTADSTTSEASSGDTAGSSDGSSSTGGELELAGSCALADHVGGFVAGFEPSYSAFSGSVADGVVPLNVLEQVGEAGSCTLLRRNNPFCDPGCDAGHA